MMEKVSGSAARNWSPALKASIAPARLPSKFWLCGSPSSLQPATVAAAATPVAVSR
jgi:hypothetical protein